MCCVMACGWRCPWSSTENSTWRSTGAPLRTALELHALAGASSSGTHWLERAPGRPGQWHGRWLRAMWSPASRSVRWSKLKLKQQARQPCDHSCHCHVMHAYMQLGSADIVKNYTAALHQLYKNFTEYFTSTLHKLYASIYKTLHNHYIAHLH